MNTCPYCGSNACHNAPVCEDCGLAKQKGKRVEQLEATQRHMDLCRSLLNVPNDEVLAERIKEMQTQIDVLIDERDTLRKHVECLKNVAKHDAESLGNFAKRLAEMRDDLIKTAQQRDVACNERNVAQSELAVCCEDRDAAAELKALAEKERDQALAARAAMRDALEYCGCHEHSDGPQDEHGSHYNQLCEFCRRVDNALSSNCGQPLLDRLAALEDGLRCAVKALEAFQCVRDQMITTTNSTRLFDEAMATIKPLIKDQK